MGLGLSNEGKQGKVAGMSTCGMIKVCMVQQNATTLTSSYTCTFFCSLTERVNYENPDY